MTARHCIGPRRWTIAAAALLLLLAGVAVAEMIWRWTHDGRSLTMKLTHRAIASTALLAAAEGAAQVPAPAGPVPPTQIGVNLSPLSYHLNSRAYANLLVGPSWEPASGNQRATLPPGLLSRQGIPRAMAGDLTVLRLPVQRSETGPGGVTIRCSWNGTADITVEGAATSIQPGDHRIDFHRVVEWSNAASVRLKVTRIVATDPLRDLDCREASLPRSATFDPLFVALADKFKVLRFMDWQNTNANQAVRWNGRARPGDLPIHPAGGMAVEDMMTLVRETGSDPWFTIPWNADDDYIARFATYVRDHLPAGAHVYVEMSNEVWNSGFDVNRQAIAEGMAAGLSKVPREAGLYRYARRSREAMEIWSRVFAAQPKALVRVLATQHWSGNAVDKLLDYEDTARHFDALATAPYFTPQNVKQPKPKTLDAAFEHLDEAASLAIDRAVKHKASAQAHGLRYIAYEGGQHIVLYTNQPLMGEINRDPRMYGVYQRYLAAWKARVGDAFVHFDSVQAPSRGGAFGLAEHPGQPLSEAPKLRAVLEAARP